MEPWHLACCVSSTSDGRSYHSYGTCGNTSSNESLSQTPFLSLDCIQELLLTRVTNSDITELLETETLHGSLADIRSCG